MARTPKILSVKNLAMKICRFFFRQNTIEFGEKCFRQKSFSTKSIFGEKVFGNKFSGELFSREQNFQPIFFRFRRKKIWWKSFRRTNFPRKKCSAKNCSPKFAANNFSPKTFLPKICSAIFFDENNVQRFLLRQNKFAEQVFSDFFSANLFAAIFFRRKMCSAKIF